MFNPYQAMQYGGGFQNPYAAMFGQQPAAAQPQSAPGGNVLPPQQVLQANGKPSIDALRMAPNSSVYIEDTTANGLVWKCVSDSLGQVTAKAFDLTPHEEAPLIDNAGLLAIVGQMNDRLTRLEGMSNAWKDAHAAAASDPASSVAKAVSASEPATP